MSDAETGDMQDVVDFVVKCLEVEQLQAKLELANVEIDRLCVEVTRLSGLLDSMECRRVRLTAALVEIANGTAGDPVKYADRILREVREDGSP